MDGALIRGEGELWGNPCSGAGQGWDLDRASWFGLWSVVRRFAGCRLGAEGEGLSELLLAREKSLRKE